MLFSLRFGIENLVRNKGRSFAALAGSLLAITLIAGANISVDVATNKILLLALEDTPIDIVVGFPDSEAAGNLSHTLEGLYGIDVAEPVLLARPQIMVNQSGAVSQIFVGVLGVDPSFGRIADRLLVDGPEFDLKANEVVVTKGFLDTLRNSGLVVEPGDNMTFYTAKGIEGAVEPEWVAQNLLITAAVETRERGWGINFGGVYFFDGMIMNRSRAGELMDQFGGRFFVGPIGPSIIEGGFSVMPVGTIYLVLLDREQVVIKTDTEATKMNIEFVTNDVKLTLAGKSPYIETPIAKAMDAYGAQLEQSRAVFLVASLPVIALGIYLAMIGVDVGFGRRRAEIALLKSRGASGRQISMLLFTEASILGVFAGTVGLILGALITGFIIFPLPEKAISLSLSDMTLLGISPMTVSVCVILGVVMMVLASYRPIKRINKIGIVEALGKYSASYETEEYKKTIDIILVLLPTAVYGTILTLQGEYGRGPSLLLFLLYIFLAIGTMILPFTPFMLILGTMRLLTRGTNRTYQLVSRAFKPLVGVLHPLIASNLSRNPRRTSRVAVLIALSLSFGTFIMVFSSTEQRFQESTLLFEVGSDIKITASSVLHGEALRSIEGVEATSEIIQASGLSRLGGVVVYALDPGDYGSCVKGNPLFTRKLARLLDELATEKTGALILKTRQETGWKEGQLISMPIAGGGESEQVDFRVLGFFDYAPGVEQTLHKGTWDAPVLLARTDYLTEQIPGMQLSSVSTILIKKADGANSSAIVDAVLDSNPDLASWNVISADQVLAEREREPMVMAVFSFMKLEFGFTLIMATFGLGLIMYLAATERQNEVAGLMARGLGKSQVMKILASEAFSIVIIAFAIGIPVGGFVVYVLRTVMNRAMAISIPVPFVFPSVLFVMLAVTAASLAAASVLSAVRISRIKPSDALRMR